MGSLLPAIPSPAMSRDRYRPPLQHATIRPGLFSSNNDAPPTYLPRGWSAHTHPSDGSIYYSQSNQPLKIITRGDMTNLQVQEYMDRSSHSMALALSDRRVSFTVQTEVYIEAHPQDPSSISYYFVDHGSRIVCWIDPINSNVLSLPPVFSELHLRPVSQKLYWDHVAFFPSHHDAALDLMLGELTDTLIYAFADRLRFITTSGFPFSLEEILAFLEVVKMLDGSVHLNSPQVIWLFATMWSKIHEAKIRTRRRVHRLTMAMDLLISPVAIILQFGRVSISMCVPSTRWFGDQVSRRLRVYNVATSLLFFHKASVSLMCCIMVCSLIFERITSGRPVLPLLQAISFGFGEVFGVLGITIIISGIILSKNIEPISAPVTTPRDTHSEHRTHLRQMRNTPLNLPQGDPRKMLCRIFVVVILGWAFVRGYVYAVLIVLPFYLLSFGMNRLGCFWECDPTITIPIAPQSGDPHTDASPNHPGALVD